MARTSVDARNSRTGSPVVALLLWFLLTACMSVSDSTYQEIETEPPGAEAVSVDGTRCTTPCSLRLPKLELQAVRIEKSGFEPAEVTITAAASHTMGTLAGNLLIGAIVGIVGLWITASSDSEDGVIAGLTVAAAGFVIGTGGIGSDELDSGSHRESGPDAIRIVLAPARAPADDTDGEIRISRYEPRH
jgi:hypothetical protein